MEEPIRQVRESSQIKRVSQIIASVSAVALGAMMFLSVADVVGRYFFLRPVEGTAELVGILLVVASSLGLGYCQLIKGNVRISVITDHFSPRGQAMMYIIAYVICIAACAIIVWQGSLMMRDFMFSKLGGVTSILSIPFWPFMLIMVLGFAWVIVIFFIDLYHSFVEVFRR